MQDERIPLVSQWLVRVDNSSSSMVGWFVALGDFLNAFSLIICL
jgi:hypothetical protein